MTTKKETTTVTDGSTTTVVSAIITPATLVAKLAAIIGSIGPQKPGARNAFHKYDYYSDEQVSALFHDKFSAAGIIIIPSVKQFELNENKTQKGDLTFLTTILVDFTITDGVETIVGTGIGQGDDPGDKGANKAMTAAQKYFLLKLGLIGSQADAEADERTDKRSAGHPPAVGPSNIEGVQRGGRNANATDAQVITVRKLARDAGLNAFGVSLLVLDTVDKDVKLPDEEEKQGPALLEFLATLTADELGSVIAALSANVAAKQEQDIPIDDSGY